MVRHDCLSMTAGAGLDLCAERRRPATEVCTSDRFIPSRGSTCSLLSHLKLEDDENWAPRNEYQAALSQNVLGKDCLENSKVLSYRHKPQRQDPSQSQLQVLESSGRASSKSSAKAGRVVPQNAAKVLDAPRLIDDFYSHPVDWSAVNVVGVALSEDVHLYNHDSGSSDRLLSLSDQKLATAIRWTGGGIHLGVGTSTGEVQIWDAVHGRQLRTLRSHGERIGALAWHGHVLTTGSADAEVHHHDVRVREHVVGRLTGHHADLICGLDYSEAGVLASGGNDNSVCIWESASSQSPLHVLREHRAAVKALRWCPWQRNVLATGGGTADRQVCLWNASNGRLLMSVDTESQVTGVVWGTQERELLTAHGYSRNQLSLWSAPSLIKKTDLEGHTGRLLGLAQSPDGAMVCSSSADETLRFWQVFSPREAERRFDRSAPTSLLRSIR
mmetsp:Transcript_4513/g.9186  ORF Transcript_4513/g.9186 Transcript_4513/m.9186 type:complete len:443 (-) Transcript_4513:56-1384(-)